MKAITLTEPWATLVLLGAKKIETRSWACYYFNRPIAIHSAKRYPKREFAPLVNTEPFRSALRPGGVYCHPENNCGQVIGIASFVACCHVELIRDKLSENELAFGNYEANRYAFQLGPIKRLAHPIPATGKLGLWEWDHTLRPGEVIEE
ncbi:MAG TPA: hypothetical protein VG345_16535 [Bryobacteraceae bacterium]|jgi:hypothetical protein|nr:hypothetical protein [Bryobacteraceae bacterium]